MRMLTTAFFSLGAFALISQTMILREFFVVVYGNEFIFGILLTNWLLGIFTGAAAGGSIADKHKDNLKLFILSLLLLTVLFPLVLTGIRFLYSLTGTTIGTYISFAKVLLYSAIFIVPISFLIGFAFPLAARVYAGTTDEQGKKVKRIAHIYILEALGSLTGGVIYTFVLVGRLSPYHIAALVILPLLFASWAILKDGTYRFMRFVSVLLLIFNVIALTPYVGRMIENYTVKKRWQSFSQLPLSYSLDSRYQNIAVATAQQQFCLYLNTTFAGVFPNDEDNMLLAAHLMVQHPEPKRILVIGDAVSGLAKYLLKYKHITQIVSVEIDPQVVETIKKFLPAEDKQVLDLDQRFQVRIMDGRQYVKDLVRQHQKEEAKLPFFDIVYVNVPEPSTMLLNRYYTVQFFEDLAKVVGPRGVVALYVTASENYSEGIVSDYTASIYHTLKEVFPYIAAAPGPETFLFASRHQDSISSNPETLKQRYTATGAKPETLGFIFHSFYPRDRTIQAKKALDRKPHYNLNTDQIPIAGFYYNKIIGWYGKSRVSLLLGFFERVSVRHVIGIVLALFLVRLGFLFLFLDRKSASSGPARRRSLKFHTLTAVFFAGMAGLALEMVILYTFQNNFGDVYHIIGFIIALFMLGLPLGAHTATTIMKSDRARDPGYRIRVIIFVLAALGLIAFTLPHTGGLFMKYSLLNQGLMFLQTILIGAAVGLIFPLSVKLYLESGGKTGKAAGIVDAFDHLGAAAGALFMGALFLPVMGVNKVCHLLALFPVLSAILLYTDMVKRKTIKKNHAPK